jgi:hypothetical protein
MIEYYVFRFKHFNFSVNQIECQTIFDVNINDSGTSNQDLWSVEKIISQVSSGPTGATGPLLL